MSPLATNGAFGLYFWRLVVFIVFVRLIPLQTTPSNWAMPDILICLCFAWVLRRADCVPILLVAAVMLTTDFLFMRPPGIDGRAGGSGGRIFTRPQPNFTRLTVFFGVGRGGWRHHRHYDRQPVAAHFGDVATPAAGSFAVPIAGDIGGLSLGGGVFTLYGLGLRKTSSGEVDALGAPVMRRPAKDSAVKPALYHPSRPDFGHLAAGIHRRAWGSDAISATGSGRSVPPVGR